MVVEEELERAIDKSDDCERWDILRISGLLVIDEENPMPRQFHLQGLKQVHYLELKKALLEMKPGKLEAWKKEEL